MGASAVAEEAEPSGENATSEQVLPAADCREDSNAAAAHASPGVVQPPDNANKRSRRKSTAPKPQPAEASEADRMEVAAGPADTEEHPTARATDLPTAVQQPAAADSAAAGPTAQPQVMPDDVST
jgi:hypothetical protein